VQLKRILTNPHCTAGTLGFHHGTMGLTNQESATINQVAGQLNAASQMHKGQAQKLRNLGFTPNSENIQFVATEVLKFTGILLGGMLVLGVPAYMLVNNPKLKKNKSKGELKTLFEGFVQQPVRTSLWWAGGSSVLIGAKDSNPKQMGAGAALMAASTQMPVSGRMRK